MQQVAIIWAGTDSQMFVGRDSYGHVVVAGSWPRHDDDTWTEWKAIKPSDLLLLSLASCSAYDVLVISARQRERLTGLVVTVEAEQDAEPPYAFRKIHLTYEAKGHALSRKKLEQAVALSEEKYCSVAATIRGVAEITHSIEIDD